MILFQKSYPSGIASRATPELMDHRSLKGMSEAHDHTTGECAYSVNIITTSLPTTPTHATTDLSPTDGSSCNTVTQSYAVKESPYSSSQHINEWPEHSRISLITAADECHTPGYYRTLNPESRIGGRMLSY